MPASSKIAINSRSLSCDQAKGEAKGPGGGGNWHDVLSVRRQSSGSPTRGAQAGKFFGASGSVTPTSCLPLFTRRSLIDGNDV